MIPILNRCLPESPCDELTAFSIYLRLSHKGEVLEIVTEIDVEPGRRMYPQVPRGPAARGAARVLLDPGESHRVAVRRRAAEARDEA